MATRQRICQIWVLAENSPFLANSSTCQKFTIFGKFEYLPKWPFSEMCRTRQTRRHSPSRVAWSHQTRQHSPSRVARTRQARQHLPSRVARARQTRERWVWQVLHKFGECGKSGEFGECRLDHFMHIKYVIWAKNDLSYHARLCQHSPRGLASTRQTRRHSPSHVARTRQTRRHSPKAIFEKNVTRLDTFARVIRHSCKFGASGHCLVKINLCN
jgi:hypothetical protein